MSILSFDDKVAVLVETPSLNNLVREIVTEKKPLSEAINQVNELLRNIGFSPFADVSLLQEVRNLYQSQEKIPAWDIEISSQPQGGTVVSIEKPTIIDGMNAEHMSVEQFLNAIKKTDTEIKRLTDMNIDSEVITKSIDKLKADRAELVSILDAKHGGDDDNA